MNGVGEGPFSNEASGTPVTVPSSPQNLQAIAGNGQITLTWQAPSSNGGSSIINYKIYRGTSPSSEIYLTTIGNILTYTNSGWTNGQLYYYKVSAVNIIAEGNLSVKVHAKPATVPNAPQNLLIIVKNRKIVVS